MRYIRNWGVILFTGCMMLMFMHETHACKPIRLYSKRKKPVVVQHKVVVNGKEVIKHTDRWGAEEIYSERLSNEEIRKRNVRADQGLIDFDVYPSNTKIYVDGRYKGLSKKYNTDKYSPKVLAGEHVIELQKKDNPRKIIKITVEPAHKTVVKQY